MKIITLEQRHIALCRLELHMFSGTEHFSCIKGI